MKEIELKDHFDRVSVNGTVLEFSRDGALHVITDIPKVEVVRPGHDGQLTARDIGRLVAGEGFYAGVWKRKIATWDLFTDTEDMPAATYSGAVRAVSKIKGLHGHDGGFFRTATAVGRALDTWNYGEQWFLPPKELANGFDAAGDFVQPDNLFTHKDKGALSDTFKLFSDSKGGADFPHLYWTSTSHRGDASMVYAVNFMSVITVDEGRNDLRLPSRPMRAKLRV